MCLDSEMVKKLWLVTVTVAALILLSVLLVAGVEAEENRLRVATTTSLYDSGLWDSLEPLFEQKYKIELDVIYAGTGIALEYGRRGDVDVLTIHDRRREEEFLKQGHGVNRKCFAYNYFLLVGPRTDPAGIKGLTAQDAFKVLIEKGKKNPGKIKFVSRGDESGTHAREKRIWRKAGFKYKSVQRSGAWYIETGRGMGPTLLMASEMQAYTLTDMASFVAYRNDLQLIPLIEKDDILFNPYSAIAVNPEKHPRVNVKMANNLINFLISDEIQEFIGRYGREKYGRQLFIPCGKGECKK